MFREAKLNFVANLITSCSSEPQFESGDMCRSRRFDPMQLLSALETVQTSDMSASEKKETIEVIMDQVNRLFPYRFAKRCCFMFANVSCVSNCNVNK
jgi:hypothetical protein